MIQIKSPFAKEDIKDLKAGDIVELSGLAYTARDAAHARLFEMMKNNEPLPFNVRGGGIFYAGPCPDMPGRVINSCGPTTSQRMNSFAPTLYDMGLSFVIGKGPVSEAARLAIARNGAVYFAAVGGAGALIASRITSAKIIAFGDLGAEAIRELYFDRVPLIVAIDPSGNSLFASKD